MSNTASLSLTISRFSCATPDTRIIHENSLVYLPRFLMVSVCADCMIHAHMHSAIPRPLVLIFLFSIDLFGQAPQGPYVPPPVLARLERLQRHEDVCALIERSGKYRLERRFAAKHEVFEGSLSPTDLEQFAAILDAAELRNIFRTDVPHPMIVDTIDKFFIDVYRNDGEQHL